MHIYRNRWVLQPGTQTRVVLGFRGPVRVARLCMPHVTAAAIATTAQKNNLASPKSLSLSLLSLLRATASIMHGS
jgi:hypothetical protein